MKTNESTAADGNTWRCTCHHVMIASTMVGLIVTHRSNDRVFVRNFSQFRHVLADSHARHVGLNGTELAANLRRSFWFQIECLKVRRTAIHPNQNAIGLGLGVRSFAC